MVNVILCYIAVITNNNFICELNWIEDNMQPFDIKHSGGENPRVRKLNH